MGWRTTWERQIFEVEGYLARSSEGETGRRMDARRGRDDTLGGRKIKVVGLVWECFGGSGASCLIKNCISPAKINLKNVLARFI